MSAEKVTAETTSAVANGWEEWFGRLESLAELKHGWNGYAAPAPGPASLAAARAFLNLMRHEQLPPTRVAPSVMGGVGITRRNGGRKVYVEFYNDGTGHALFSSGAAGMDTRPVPGDPEGARAFLAAMRNNLDG